MSPDDITPAWLSGVFGTEVLSFNTKICEGGQLSTTILITDIKLKDEKASRPSSVAVKLHSPLPSARGLSVATFAYRREIWFYVRRLCSLLQ